MPWIMNMSGLWICQGSEYNGKRLVLDCFCNLVFLLRQKLTIRYFRYLYLFPGLSFLGIIFNVIIFADIQFFFLPFN